MRTEAYSIRRALSSISRSEPRDNVIESGCEGELAIEEQRYERLAEKTVGLG